MLFRMESSPPPETTIRYKHSHQRLSVSQPVLITCSLIHFGPLNASSYPTYLHFLQLQTLLCPILLTYNYSLGQQCGHRDNGRKKTFLRGSVAVYQANGNTAATRTSPFCQRLDFPCSMLTVRRLQSSHVFVNVHCKFSQTGYIAAVFVIIPPENLGVGYRHSNVI